MNTPKATPAHTQTGWQIAASSETTPQQYVTYRGEGYSLTYEQAQFVAAAANERDALRAEVERLRELLTDIEFHLSGGAALHPGSLIFAEDAPAIDVIRAALRGQA